MELAAQTAMALSADPAALVVNTGSSSLKLVLCAANGLRLWQEQRSWRQGELGPLLEEWLAPQLARWGTLPPLVVHRLVHGGSQFSGPIRLDSASLASLRQLVPLAPLHNGAALAVIDWLQQQPQARGLVQWACFDTAFHASLPEEARTYAIPAAWRQQGLRRYGFHGLNHQHVAETVSRREPAVRRLISCHLGAGCSLCAIALEPGRAPRSLDTTMGFTPLEGLVMASRSGSVDPGLLLHLLRHGMDADQLDEALHRRSGLLGLSGLSGDMRELRSAAAAGHGGARLALAVFRHRLLQGIAAMAASLGGVDGIALSGGIGEHDDALHAELREALHWLGTVRWLRIPADEEGVMVRQCLNATP
jgi:acetate kinase